MTKSFDERNAVRSVQEVVGRQVPDRVIDAQGTPWSMHAVLRMAYVAGRESVDTSRAR